MRVSLTILLLCILAVPAAAQDAESALEQFKGKILILRHPLQASSQQYDSAGKVLKGGPEGPWTVYGGVFIEKIALRPDKLRVDGQRVLFQFENQQFTAFEFTPLDHAGAPPFPSWVHLEIRLDGPLNSAEQAYSVLNRVFALNTADLMDSLPAYWRTCLDGRLRYDPSQKQEAEFTWQAPPPSANKPRPDSKPKEIIEEISGTPQTVYHVGPQVKAPKVKFTPEPQFSDIARYENLGGTLAVDLIVGTDGKVHRIRLVSPLGLGLDEVAQSTIQTWRFYPATRNGEPVAVEMIVEVGFNVH